MPTSEAWVWRFTSTGADDFDVLDGHIQNRIVEKLDEIARAEWREPTAHIEPLTGAPYGKIRVGNYRLAVDAHREDRVLTVLGVEILRHYGRLGEHVAPFPPYM